MYIGSQNLMKKYDQCLLNEGYSLIELVDRASDCLLKHMNYQHVAILCGPGNNGADGLSLGIKLYKQGIDIIIYIFDDHRRLSEANQYYLNQCYQLQLQVILLDEEKITTMVHKMLECDAIVDAMFGFGLNSSPRGLYSAVIEEVNQLYDQEIIAVDIPTGLDCNSGKPYQSVICATQTITLSAMKNGFLNPDSQSFTGNVIVEHLAVKDVSADAGLYLLFTKQQACQMLKTRLFDGHKGTYGRALCLTGCSDYKGAALLSAKSCVYCGCGITTVMSDQQVIDALSLYCPEATTQLRAPILRKEDFDRYKAILIGCGLGLDLDAFRYVIDVFSLSHQPLVIDADALTILSSRIDLLKQQQRDIILTPHMGEFYRLCEFEEHDDILDVAKNFARDYHVVLVLKGPYTIVTDGDMAYRVDAGNKAMATGGMGDVLAGMITSFLAQGYQALQAALLGVYIHGYCGDMIAKEAYTVIPSRLIERIPLSMNELLQLKNNPNGLF